MKVLFLAHQCLPTLDANGNCVNKLRANLAKLNVSSDVLSFRLKNGIPDQKLDDFGTIYIANTWMRFGHTHRIETPNRFLIMLKLFYVVPVRIFHFLCGGRKNTMLLPPASHLKGSSSIYVHMKNMIGLFLSLFLSAYTRPQLLLIFMVQS